MEKNTYLIVGLGNPGKLYLGTRHNVGYGLLDAITEKYNINMKRERFKSFFGEGILFGNKCFFLKPLTYMNLSGEAVIDAVNYYKIDPKNIIVLVDDIDIPFGRVKVKKGGSSGTHNGLKSIIYNLETDEFPRIKLSVGKCPENIDLKDFVLSKFSSSEKKILQKEIELGIIAIEEIIQNDVEVSMCKVNGIKIEE